MSGSGATSIIDFITRAYTDLSPAYRRVADIILASPHEAALMTLEAMAAASQTSIATSNRFARRIGLQSYPELKRLLRGELQQALKPVEALIDSIHVPSWSRSAPWTRSIEEDLRQISSIEPAGGDQAFVKASDAIVGAKRVFVAGFGSSSFIAEYCAFNLSSLRDDVYPLVDASGLEGAQRRLLGSGPEDCVIMIGFARYSASAVQLAKQLQRRQVPLVAITDGADSPIARAATAAFFVPRKSSFVLTGAGAAGLAVVEALLHGVAALLGPEQVERRFARLTSQLGRAIVSPGSSGSDEGDADG
jgi:DNA-binding MurR/RpiR family transcriptional regulator